MGNVAAKHPHRSHMEQNHSSSVVHVFRSKEGRKSSSASSASSSDDYLDAETDIHSSTDEEQDFEELFARTHDNNFGRTHEDAFMKAVLAFCAHMGGRMDALDNARLYDEFCSYAASHSPKVGVV